MAPLVADVGPDDAAPDYSTPSRTRTRLRSGPTPLCPALVRGLLAERGPIKGLRVEANASRAAMRRFRRRDRCSIGMQSPPQRFCSLVSPIRTILRKPAFRLPTLTL